MSLGDEAALSVESWRESLGACDACIPAGEPVRKKVSMPLCLKLLIKIEL